MNWKEQLRELEKAKKWDEAIKFMQGVIKEHPNDKDTYIFMNYLLMNLLGEEDYDDSKEATYMNLAKWYFDESYAKYSEDPEFLYITGKTAVMGPWFFGIDQEDHENMIKKAHKLESNNPLYNEHYYYKLEREDPIHSELIAFAKLVLSENSSIEEQLETKGAVGEYLFTMKKRSAEGILKNAAKVQKVKI